MKLLCFRAAVFQKCHPICAPGNNIRVDVNQIEQALMNICINARDAMPEGGVIAIECDQVEIDREYCGANINARVGRYCLIQVTDTGTGMPESVRQKILEPFFTTKGPGKGTGLGLSVAHGIVMSHGGFMNIRSEPAEGTVVSVYIPIAGMGEAQEETNASSVELCRGTGTILVVDDEMSVLKLLSRALTGAGYKVYNANKGAEALNMYREHIDEIALVVLDMVMPDMGGAEVFKELKALNPGVMVLLSSGYSADGKAGELLAAGVKGFIQKPFAIADLCDAVKKILDSQPGK